MYVIAEVIAYVTSMVPTILRKGTERNGTPDSAKYLFCGTYRNGPKTASQLSGYYIEMYPKPSSTYWLMFQAGTERKVCTLPQNTFCGTYRNEPKTAFHTSKLSGYCI